MSERKSNFYMTKFASAIAAPLVIGGAVAVVHGRRIENSGAENRQVQRDTISRQVDSVFPSYDKNAVNNSKQLITLIQHELADLIANGEINAAKERLSLNSEGLQQLGVISQNETIKNNIKLEIVDKKDLDERGKGSWYSLFGGLTAVAGITGIASGFMSDADAWLEKRKYRNAPDTNDESKTSLA